MHTAVDPQLSRTAALAGGAGLIPLPFVDTWVGNRFRRSLTRQVLARRGVELPAADVATLSDATPLGLRKTLLAIVTWPFQVALRALAVVGTVRRAVSARNDALQSIDVLEEALDYGLLPGDAAAVRARIDAP